jgi:hypothetical protein
MRAHSLIRSPFGFASVAMTDEEVTEAAKSDPDAQPVSAEWFARAAKRRAARKVAAE